MVTIQSNHYPQLRDYLKQMLKLCGKDTLPKITQSLIANKLEAAQSSLSVFLGDETKTSPKVLKNFIAKYPLEVQQWPAGSNLIGRVLQVRDAMLFLGIQPPPHPQPVARPINPPFPPIPLAPIVNQAVTVPNVQHIVTIQANHYPQLRDYLKQMVKLSGKDTLPKITQSLIGEKLEASQSSLSVFLGDETKTSPKLLKNFIAKYPLEVQQWPAGSNLIGRVLQVRDAVLFLGIQPPPLLQPVARPIHPPLPPIPPAPIVNQAIPAPNVRQAAFKISQLAKATIAISYRGHQSPKDGEGMLFDHMRFQDITKCETAVLIAAQGHISKLTSEIFVDVLKHHSAQLPFSPPNQDLICCPPFTQDCAELGLLIVPGRIRKIEDEPVRLRHEYQVIRGALNRGQPILGLCAGSWRLFEQLFIWINSPEKLNQDPIQLSNFHKKNLTLVDASDHCYGGGMVRLDKMGVQPTLNVQIHDILIDHSSLLKKGLGSKAPERQTVNSVHWKAVNPAQIPTHVKISARAALNPTIQKNTRQSVPMKPQENTVEAFECNFGAPVMGIQWHPEGYFANSSNGSLLKYMACAGSAYAAKRKMLTDLKKWHRTKGIRV